MSENSTSTQNPIKAGRKNSSISKPYAPVDEKRPGHVTNPRQSESGRIKGRYSDFDLRFVYSAFMSAIN